MKAYKVTIYEHILYFIAEDRDMLLTLVSTLLKETDYAALNKMMCAEQVAGNKTPDSYNFYKALV